MGTVDYLSRNPKSEPWPESVLDEKFVVTSIESFHKALDCLNSRLRDHDMLDRNKNILEYSRIDQNASNRNTSSTRCYGKQNGSKRTKHDRNERNEDSRSFQREKLENPKISLSQNRQQIQSVESLEKKQKFSKPQIRKYAIRRNSKKRKRKVDSQDSGKEQHEYIEGGGNRNNVSKKQDDTKDPKQIRLREFGFRTNTTGELAINEQTNQDKPRKQRSVNISFYNSPTNASFILGADRIGEE